jgi:hypothetical protein
METKNDQKNCLPNGRISQKGKNNFALCKHTIESTIMSIASVFYNAILSAKKMPESQTH